MRILSLHTEGFGARGGIAAYNRDMVTAWCSHPRVTEVVALSLRHDDPATELPAGLSWIAEFDNHKPKFTAKAMSLAALHGPWDLVICGHVNFMPLAVAASRVARAPLLLMVYGIDVWEPHASRLVNESLRFVDSLVSISQLTVNKMNGWRALRDVPQFICPNAVHPEAFGVKERPAHLVERYRLGGRKVLVTVARLNPMERYKGIDEVIELMPKLHERHPNLSYLVVGSGPDRDRLEAKAKRLGVSDAVVFAGYAPDDELADHYRVADAFVMPGWGEGFGFVYLEALACGIPVVASQVDGSREAVREGMLGEMVNPHDLADVERGILAALERPRGEIPDGLAFFYWDEFERRCHAVIDAVTR